MSRNLDKTVVFREVQNFRQLWLWVLLLPVLLFLVILFGYGMIKQLLFGQPWGNRPLPDIALAVVGPLFIIFAGIIFYIFTTYRLVTEVAEDGIHINFAPLAKKSILFREIDSCEVRTYRPLLEYGGWGLRWTPWKGQAYSVKGNRGVQLKLSSGQRILIGSQQPEELARLIKERMRAQKPIITE